MSSLCTEPSWRPLLTQLTPSPFFSHIYRPSYGTCIDNGRSMRTEEGPFRFHVPVHYPMRPIASNQSHSDPPTQTQKHPHLISIPSREARNPSTFASPHFCLFTPFHSERVFYSSPTTLHISLLGSYHLWVMWSESGGILLLNVYACKR